MTFLFRFIDWIRSLFSAPTVNSVHTPIARIIDQMNEPRPLPMGQKEFVEWSDRIISGALVPTDDKSSQVAALAVMLMNLGNTESHKSDAYFIHSLRKAAVNEVAHANFTAIKAKKQEQAKKELEATAAAQSDSGVENLKRIQEAALQEAQRKADAKRQNLESQGKQVGTV